MTYDVAPGTQTSALISAMFKQLSRGLSRSFHCRSPTEQQQKWPSLQGNFAPKNFSILAECWEKHVQVQDKSKYHHPVIQ